jgi:hypothetical protein
VIESETKIRKGPPAANVASYVTTRDILIPAGTILRDPENAGIMTAGVGFGPGVQADFQIEESAEAEACGVFRRVTAA